MAVFPLEAFKALRNLFISPFTVIPQLGILPRLVFDLTWSGINKATKRLSPMEAMRFGDALHRILKQVITADLHLGPVYLLKVDLDDTYMRL